MDKRLVQQAKEGNPIAYGRLIGRYFEKVCFHVQRIVGNRSDAEEITQDAFWKGYTNLDSLKDPSRFLPWIMRIAHNLALNWREREKVDLISLEDVPAEQLCEGGFEDEILREEAWREVREAMLELSEEDRKLLEMYLDGRRYREISDQMGLSEGALRVRMSRLKRRLRERVLRRLSGIMIFPWGKIGRMIGGVVMKATTKVAITGAVVLMLGGAGIWMTMHRGDEKPIVKPSGVKVERQTSVGAPARVALRKPKPKKEKDVITFEEFNRLLDEYFAKEGKEEESEQGIYPEVESDMGEEKVEEPEKETKGTTSVTQRTPEQQRLYEILESITWVWEEMNELSHQINEIAAINRRLYEQFQRTRDPKTGLLDGDWYMKYYYPYIKKQDKLEKRHKELSKIWFDTLERYFPEAVLGNRGGTDFSKLREYVGGLLPWDYPK